MEWMELGKTKVSLFLSQGRVKRQKAGGWESKLMIGQGGDLHPEVGSIYLFDPLPFVNERDQFFMCWKQVSSN